MDHNDKEIDDEQQQQQQQQQEDDDDEKLVDDDDDDVDDDDYQDNDDDVDDDDVNNDYDDDNIKVVVVPDEDENIFLSSSDENDDIDDNNLLDFLMTYNKLKHRNKQKKEGKFLPLLKNFLKASIEHKKEIYERNEKRRYVAKNILDKKIPIDLMRSEKHVLQKLVNNKYKKFDRKILFIENFHLHSVFERAVCLLKKEQKIKDE